MDIEVSKIEENIMNQLHLLYLIKYNNNLTKQIQKNKQTLTDKETQTETQTQTDKENVKLIIQENTEASSENTIQQLLPQLSNLFMNKDMLFTKVEEEEEEEEESSFFRGHHLHAAPAAKPR